MLKKTWRKQVVEERMKVGLRREDPRCRSKGVLALVRLLLG